MSTTYLTTNHNSAALYMNRTSAATTMSNRRDQVNSSSAREGVDEGILMIGVFCFLVPTMFLSAALGLKYLEMSDLIANGLYIAAAALVARVATAFIIKNMAAEKNRSEAAWMTLAVIAPAVSLILMSFFGTVATKVKATKASAEKTATTTIKNYSTAREIQMSHQSKAM